MHRERSKRYLNGLQDSPSEQDRAAGVESASYDEPTPGIERLFDAIAEHGSLTEVLDKYRDDEDLMILATDYIYEGRYREIPILFDASEKSVGKINHWDARARTLVALDYQNEALSSGSSYYEQWEINQKALSHEDAEYRLMGKILVDSLRRNMNLHLEAFLMERESRRLSIFAPLDYRRNALVKAGSNAPQITQAEAEADLIEAYDRLRASIRQEDTVQEAPKPRTQGL